MNLLIEASARERRLRAIRRAQRLERSLYAVGTATIADIRRALERARTETIALLAQAEPGSWQRHQQQAVLAELERQLAIWRQSSTAAVRRALEQAHAIGQELATAPLEAGGIEIAARPQISTAYLAAAFQSSADLIDDVSGDLIREVDRLLRRAALAQMTPWDVIQLLGPLAGPGKFATALHRAEAIVRTEMGRVASTASQATLQELHGRDPLLAKEWHAILDVRVRPDHAAADGQRVPVDQPFAVGGEQLMYPHDPRGSARNTVNCRCLSLPWHPDWVDVDINKAGATSSTSTLDKTLRTTEQQLNELRDHEEAAIVDERGNILLRKGGEATHVNFTDEETAAMAGKVLTHNHPLGWGFRPSDPRYEGNSFSFEDVRLAHEAGLAEMRATTPVWRYSLKPGTAVFSADTWRGVTGPLSMVVDMEVRIEFTRQINQGRMTYQEAEGRHRHEVMTRLAARLGWAYSRKRWRR